MNANENAGALPSSISDAPVPQSYERAKAELAQCEQVDECKEWADRGLALASYARQAQDEELEMHARRIRNRAIARMGELLERIDPDKPGPKPEIGGASSPYLSPRRKAAQDAGISVDQQKQALRVARVPKSDFEALTERERPATVTELAALGTRTLGHLHGSGETEGSALVRAMENLAEYASRREVVDGLKEAELQRAVRASMSVSAVVTAVMSRAKGGKNEW